MIVLRNKSLYIVVFILSNFFLLTLFMQLLNLVGFDFYIKQLMNVVFAITGLYCLINIKYTCFDIIILIYMFYILINGIVIDYQNHGSYFYKAMIIQYFPIFTYFIGRYLQIDLSFFLSKMKYPLLFAMLCGIYFYISEPGWYIAMKLSQLRAYASDYQVAEIYRLSSFWGHPYVISYSTLLYSLYLTHNLINGISGRKEKIISILILMICYTILMLSQMRVTILFYLIALFYMSFENRLLYKNRNNYMSKFLIILVVIGIIYMMLTLDESSYIVKHMMGITESEALNDRFAHTSGGIINYSFFGDGFGRYDMYARTFEKWAIVDQEFQNHIAELGYLGISLLILILLFSIYRCFKKHFLLLENSVLLFFIVAMIGASVLSNEHQYNYIFWYTLGIIWSNKYVTIKKKRLYI